MLPQMLCDIYMPQALSMMASAQNFAQPGFLLEIAIVHA